MQVSHFACLRGYSTSIKLLPRLSQNGTTLTIVLLKKSHNGRKTCYLSLRSRQHKYTSWSSAPCPLTGTSGETSRPVQLATLPCPLGVTFVHFSQSADEAEVMFFSKSLEGMNWKASVHQHSNPLGFSPFVLSLSICNTSCLDICEQADSARGHSLQPSSSTLHVVTLCTSTLVQHIWLSSYFPGQGRPRP